MRKVGGKLSVNASDFVNWAGAVSGKLGQLTATGFEVVDAGIKIFEKKLKDLKPEVSIATSDPDQSSGD